MVSKNFLPAPLLCCVLLTGAPKSENGFRIFFRGDWPLVRRKISDHGFAPGRLGRTKGVLRGKRD